MGLMGSRRRSRHASVTVIAMIEDPAALDHLDDILAVEGLDKASSIGRGDLTGGAGRARARSSPETTAAGWR